MSDHYQILGVARGAEPAAIKAAYRRLALQYHPDRNRSPGAVAEFQKIQRAYEVLSRPDMRHRYDRIRTYRHERPATAPASRHADDRKYGTRHRFTNPPPTGAAQKRAYEKYLREYELFTKSGLQQPKHIWRKRFGELLQEGKRNYPWILGISLLMFALGVIIASTDGWSLFAFNGFLISGMLAWSVLTDKAPKSLAERKAGKG